MSVPDYQSLMLPVLVAVSDGLPYRVADVRRTVASTLGLTPDDLAERIPSGQPVFDSRVNWAATYMAQAGLLRRPRRGILELTDRGRSVLAENPTRVDNVTLSRYPEFLEFKMRATGSQDEPPAASATPGGSGTDARAGAINAPTAETTPLEQLERAVKEANSAVSTELLQRIRERDPDFLERLVLRLLTAMGYGGKAGAAQHLGRSGDQGLDGVIRQDALGLERVYVQAKRYGPEQSIGRPDIQAFVGALHGAQADRGVFIATTRFTSEARDYAERVAARVVLIDGIQLAELMILHNVGVQDERTFTLRRVDEDFFDTL
ncbi:restriction system protein [Krasilnikovia cinnamomea]|uniref:Restriction system protein n=1 Tax=Krasilnikovia cinnamomea TaxID=349313 RepID=A0A4Q7ZNS3_9ACTN|nr:restriction endonuclease [Krasilnikovia cinnamomea]RZU52697.1 restriction system protein [Krasilnikovia cinnamomea]